MSKITIDVTNDNLKTVLNILENLKEGLVENIQIDKSATKYKPKNNKVIKENEPVAGKYINSTTFKKRLNKKK